MRIAGAVLLASVLMANCEATAQKDSPVAARTALLISQLGTGNIQEEEAAKKELLAHPRPEALPVLLNAFPKAWLTVQYEILDVLAVYNDPTKIPKLIEFVQKPQFRNDFAEKAAPQLEGMGKPAADALITSLPENCDGQTQQSRYSQWAGRVLRNIEPHGERALLIGLAGGGSCERKAAQTGILERMSASPPDVEQTEEDDAEVPSRMMLFSAADHETPAVRDTAKTWIYSLQSKGWGEIKYSQYMESVIAAYRSESDPGIQGEMAQLLAEFPCARVSRFMRAALQSPNRQVRGIAYKYQMRRLIK